MVFLALLVLAVLAIAVSAIALLIGSVRMRAHWREDDSHEDEDRRYWARVRGRDE